VDEKALTGEPDDVCGRSREDISFVDSCCCHQQVPEKAVICFFSKFQRFILQKDASDADFHRFFGTLQLFGECMSRCEVRSHWLVRPGNCRVEPLKTEPLRHFCANKLKLTASLMLQPPAVY